jgi:hypothetical protein
VTGTVAEPNCIGVAIKGDGNVIGGTGPAQRNLISGNASYGVANFGGSYLAEGNYVGTDHTGNSALGNYTGLGTGGDGDTIIGTSSPGTPRKASESAAAAT